VQDAGPAPRLTDTQRGTLDSPGRQGLLRVIAVSEVRMDARQEKEEGERFSWTSRTSEPNDSFVTRHGNRVA
jgi:hypothetical protein